jgi:hypothetical protein
MEKFFLLDKKNLIFMRSKDCIKETIERIINYLAIY